MLCCQVSLQDLGVPYRKAKGQLRYRIVNTFPEEFIVCSALILMGREDNLNLEKW